MPSEYYNGYDPDDPTSTARADYLLRVNLQVPMALTTALVPQLKLLPEAMVVNVSSGLAIAPNSAAAYCASKAGLRAFTMSLRHHLRGTKVHVMEALLPMVDTQMNATKTGKKTPPGECAQQIIRATIGNCDEANVGTVKMLRAIYSLSPALARKMLIGS